MPTILQLRRGTTAEHASFTGAVGEVTINTTKDTAVVHDGSTQGGFELLRANLSNVSGDTDNITEGSTNLYYTNARVDSEIDAYLAAGTGVSISSGTIAVDTTTIATKTYVDSAILTKDNTDEITEGSTNLYYTDARVKTLLASYDTDIIPDADNTRSLGSASYQWKDVFVGPGSLYVNGQQVVSDNSGTITISADTNQNVSVQTSGSGDIEIDPTGSGIIQIKGTLQIEDGNNITNSAGNAISFSNGIASDSLTSKTADTNLTLSGNGTGNVVVSDGLSVGGALTVTGDLTVNGTTTTINSTTMAVDDLNITVASGAANAAAANGAGITVDGASATITYASTGDKWVFNKALDMGANDVTTSGAFIGALTGNVTGDVTGNLTGNVTGNVTGNLTGNVTGDVTGDVTGNLTGNVTGNVTGVGTLSAGSTAPTVAEGTNNTTIATTEFVMRAIATLQASQYAGGSS